MKRVSVILVASAATLVLSAAGRVRNREPDAREIHLRAEAIRLRAHFDSVDRELRARDVSTLTGPQRASRTRLISWLRDYRNAGRFPENDQFSDRMVPIFRDSRGTLCAMAYLVDRAGRGDIVDHVARTRNNAFIPELTDDAELVAWLETSGLSVKEAARIQPQYGTDPVIIITNENRVSTNYAILSMGLGGSSLGTLGFNILSPGYASGAAGVVAGVATIIAGAAHLEESGGNKKVAVANTAVGSVALVGGLRGLFAARAVHMRQHAATSNRGIISEATIAPDLIVGSNRSRFGVRLNARF
jgi:hypothetical protein